MFKVAGKVMNVDILTDHSGKSKGLGEVQFEEPGDSIGAIGEPAREVVSWCVLFGHCLCCSSLVSWSDVDGQAHDSQNGRASMQLQNELPLIRTPEMRPPLYCSNYAS